MVWLYLVPNMKTWPTSMPFASFRVAVSAGRPDRRFGHFAKICELFHLKVAVPVGVQIMRIGFDSRRPQHL